MPSCRCSQSISMVSSRASDSPRRLRTSRAASAARARSATCARPRAATARSTSHRSSTATSARPRSTRGWTSWGSGPASGRRGALALLWRLAVAGVVVIALGAGGTALGVALARDEPATQTVGRDHDAQHPRDDHLDPIDGGGRADPEACGRDNDSRRAATTETTATETATPTATEPAVSPIAPPPATAPTATTSAPPPPATPAPPATPPAPPAAPTAPADTAAPVLTITSGPTAATATDTGRDRVHRQRAGSDVQLLDRRSGGRALHEPGRPDRARRRVTTDSLSWEPTRRGTRARG